MSRHVEWRRPVPTGASLPECDQPPLPLVPELQLHAPDPVPQRERRDLGEDRVGVVRVLEVVVGDPGAEVVDVVQADVAGEAAAPSAA